METPISNTAPAAAGPESIAARIDALPSAARVWPLVMIVSLGGWFEFYDLMMTGYISPGLVQAGVFHEGKAGLFGQSDQATFAAATFLGMFLGALVFARAADRWGRRRVFALSLAWYALATLAMSTAQTAVQLDIWRLISGIGFGVELTTIDTYVSEIMPARLRGRAFAINQAIQFSAVPAVAFACWKLLPMSPLGIEGWRWVMVSGSAGAVAVWFLQSALPESPRWLERRGRMAEADAIVRGLEGRTGDEIGALPPPPAPEPAGRIIEAFAPALRRRTVMLIVFNIFQAIGFYGFGNWAPSLIAAKGHSVTHSLGYAFAIAIAWPLGPLLCSAFADRLERKTQIMIAAATTAGLGLIFARQTAPAALIALGMGITASNNLLSYAFHAYQTELYPTRIRAAAVGFVYSFSRISTVASSFIIAALLSGYGANGVFLFISLAMGVVVASIGLFGPRTNQIGLEQLSG